MLEREERLAQLTQGELSEISFANVWVYTNVSILKPFFSPSNP